MAAESVLTPLALPRILRPLAAGASMELQRALCELRLEEAAQRRFDELATKNTEGSLDESEREELAEFVELNRFVSTLKAEAVLAQRRPHAA